MSVAVSDPVAANALSPAIELAIQSALLLVPAVERAAFTRDLHSLAQALVEGRDGDAIDLVERYHLGANFGAVILGYRRRTANGRH